MQVDEILFSERMVDEPIRVAIGTQASEPEIKFAVPVPDDVSAGQVLDEAGVRCRGELPNYMAALAPLVAVALHSWESQNLELGETAVVCGDGVFAEVLGGVAGWWTPTRIRLGTPESTTGSSTFPQVLDRHDPDSQRRLSELLTGAPGVALIGLSAAASDWDIMLEAAPYWARFLALGCQQSTMTIDFYNNVHRKGVTLLGQAFDEHDLLLPERGLFNDDDLRRAQALLLAGRASDWMNGFFRSID